MYCLIVLNNILKWSPQTNDFRAFHTITSLFNSLFPEEDEFCPCGYFTGTAESSLLKGFFLISHIVVVLRPSVTGQFLTDSITLTDTYGRERRPQEMTRSLSIFTLTSRQRKWALTEHLDMESQKPRRCCFDQNIATKSKHFKLLYYCLLHNSTIMLLQVRIFCIDTTN